MHVNSMIFYSAIKLPANPDAPAYQIEVVLDPVSQEAQKIAPMIKVSGATVNDCI